MEETLLPLAEKQIRLLTLKLSLSNVKLGSFLLKTASLQLNAVQYEAVFGDESWLARKAIEWQRKVCLSDLNQLKNEMLSAFGQFETLLAELNQLYSGLGLPSISFENSLSKMEFKLDPSTQNAQWGERFQEYINQITQSVEMVDEITRQADQQVNSFS